jgi:hypothetical protein
MQIELATVGFSRLATILYKTLRPWSYLIPDCSNVLYLETTALYEPFTFRVCSVMLACYEYWVRKRLTSPHLRQTPLEYDAFRTTTPLCHETRKDNFYARSSVLLSVLFVKLHKNIYRAVKALL